MLWWISTTIHGIDWLTGGQVVRHINRKQKTPFDTLIISFNHPTKAAQRQKRHRDRQTNWQRFSQLDISIDYWLNDLLAAGWQSDRHKKLVNRQTYYDTYSALVHNFWSYWGFFSLFQGFYRYGLRFSKNSFLSFLYSYSWHTQTNRQTVRKTNKQKAPRFTHNYTVKYWDSVMRKKLPKQYSTS